MGADPVAYAIAAASWGTDLVIDAFSVRKEAKEHGTGQRIEGNFTTGRRGGRGRGRDHLGRVGPAGDRRGGGRREARVVGVLAVVDREQGGGEMLAEEGRQVVVLTTASELGLKAKDFTGN